MRKLINIIKTLKRYIVSIYWYLRLIYRNKAKNLSKDILKEFQTFEDVHILCPGPSLDLIKKKNIDKSSLLIFVNHAIDLCNIISLEGISKVSFSADPVRAKEIIKGKKEKLNSCKSFLMPGHIFHLNKNIFKNYDYIFNIRPKFSKSFGIVSKSIENKKSIKAPKRFFRSYGYGSLNCAVIFSLLFKPQKIHFWGCDFFSSKGKLYSDLSGGDKYAYKVDFSYYEKKMKKEFNTLSDSLRSKGIEIIFNQ